MRKTAFAPFLGLIIGIAAVSTAALLIRLAQEQAPSFVIAAGRLTISALLIAPFALGKIRIELTALSKKARFLLVLGGVFLGLHFAAWITSLEFTSVASSVVIVTTAPLWVAVLSPLFLNEKITGWAIGGLVVSLLGSIIVGMSSACSIESGNLVCQPMFSITSGRMFTGNVLALLGAFLSAGYLMVGRHVRKSINLIPYTFVVYTVAAIVLILLVIISGQPVTGYPALTYVWIIALALVPQLIGHSSFNWALKYLSASLVSIALLGEPVGTIILSYLFLKESPTIFEVVGGVLILAGISIASKNRTPQVPVAET